MKKTILYILPLTLLTSCSSELVETASDVAGGNVERVTIKSKPFEFDDDTRTSLTATSKGISFGWASYDALGVFPIAPETNNQAKQKLNVLDDADAQFATFDGAGWALSSKNTYAAYCPYNGQLPASTPYTAVPIDMIGQDGTLATIGKKYDYMYAPSSFATKTLSDGAPFEVVFDFAHAVSILQLNLTMPVAATWKSVTLANASGKKVWTTNATMNVSDGTINSLETNASIYVTLKNVVTTDNNKQLTLYVAALPTITEALTLTATTTEETEYTATLASKNLQPGKAYRYSASLTEVSSPGNGHEWVNLGLPSGVKWATMNIGSTSPEDYGQLYGYSRENVYDLATQNWGGAWRLPTKTELEELVNNCYWVWTSSYNGTGKAGYIAYKAKSSSDKGQIVKSSDTPSSSYSLSDTHIFLPAAGYEWNGDGHSHTISSGNTGHYWTSSSNNENGVFFHALIFDSNQFNFTNMSFVHWALSIRAVCM